MYIKLIFKYTINNKQMYSPRLYKYRNSYSIHIRFGKLYAHSFGKDTHMTFPPPGLKIFEKYIFYEPFVFFH